MSDEERETVRVTLFRESFGVCTDIYRTLPDAIEWLQSLLADVPAEFHDNSRFEIESDSDYDGGYNTSLTIYFDRPITDAEIAQRAAEQEAYARRIRLGEEARERATLARLRAKYPNA